MTFQRLQALDLSWWEEPEPTLERREFLEQWLRYQRHEFLRKLRTSLLKDSSYGPYPRSSFPFSASSDT